MIMELCTGRELFDYVEAAAGRISEAQVGRLVGQMLSAVCYMHDRGYAHRDLKPENFLLQAPPTDDSPPILKLADFGLSKEISKDGRRFTEPVGTPYYLAPQVINQNYNELCDIWSLGIITFILLFGFPPFHGPVEIVKGRLYVNWKLVSLTRKYFRGSASAANMMFKMLTFDDTNRPSAKALLDHEWLKMNTPRPKNADAGTTTGSGMISTETIDKLKEFHAMCRFKKLVLTIIATRLTEDEKGHSTQAFRDFDTDGNGRLSLYEIQEFCAKQRSDLSEKQIADIFHELDTDKSGHLDHTEFIAATMDASKSTVFDDSSRKRLISEAFRHFDADGDGTVSKQELADALQGKLFTEESSGGGGGAGASGDSDLTGLFNKIDKDGDGTISFGEFRAMMGEEWNWKSDDADQGGGAGASADAAAVSSSTTSAGEPSTAAAEGVVPKAQAGVAGRK